MDEAPFERDGDVDIVVRTFNTHYARGARRRGWPEYPTRLALAAEKIHAAWPHQLGLIGVQEAGDRVDGCRPKDPDPGRRSVTVCLAAHLGRAFGIEAASVEHRELGLLWDAGAWEQIPGGGAWRIGWSRPRLVRFKPDLGATRYLLGVKLRHRARGWVISCFTTHLANDPVRLGERERQIDRLLPIIDRVVSPGELPPVLVGDMNFREPERSTFERLHRRFALACTHGGVDHVWIGRPEHFSGAAGAIEPVPLGGASGSHAVELREHRISDHPLVSVGFVVGDASP